MKLMMKFYADENGMMSEEPINVRFENYGEDSFLDVESVEDGILIYSVNLPDELNHRDEAEVGRVADEWWYESE